MQHVLQFALHISIIFRGEKNANYTLESLLTVARTLYDLI